MHKNLRKLLVLILILVVPITSYSASFPDMPNDWSRPALEYMIKEGLIKGIDGKIMPDQKLTRAQLVTMMNRKLGLKETTDISNFQDLNKKAWYYEELKKGVKFGLIEGSNNRLRPNDPITRQEAFVIVDRAIKPENKNIYKKFKDDKNISAWAKESIYRLSSNGYINGSSGRINPKKHISRKEFSQVLYNIEKVKDNPKDGDSNVSIKPLEPEDDKNQNQTNDIDKEEGSKPSFELDNHGRAIVRNEAELTRYLNEKLSNFESDLKFSLKDYKLTHKEVGNYISRFFIENAELDYGYAGLYTLITSSKDKLYVDVDVIYSDNIMGISDIEDEEIRDKYRKSKAQIEKEKRLVDEKIDRVLSEIIHEGMSDFEKEKAIHDYIILNAEYAKDVDTNPKRSYYTPYGIIIEGKGVCAGYSKAFLAMARRAGLEAKYVQGLAKGGSHAWNMVKLDGDWYNLDVTWDDWGGNRISYRYFNLDDRIFNNTHKADTEYISYPRANGRKYHRDTLGLR